MSVGSRQNECLAADIAAEALSSANILVVAAAGNNNIDACMVHPASSKNTVTVGAVGLDDATSKDIVWAKSNHGECVTVHAPGQSITSAGLTSPDAEKVMSGTSMAAPMIAGQSLLIMAAAPHLPVSAVREIIVSSATRGTLDSSDDAHSDVKIAHVPWKMMQYQGAGVRSSSSEFEGAAGDDSAENDMVQFDLQTTSLTDPPMQYVGDFLAQNITARLAKAGSESLSTSCSLSPENDADSEPGSVQSSISKEKSRESLETPDALATVLETVRDEGASEISIRLRCQIRCSEGRGKDVMSAIDRGCGKDLNAKLAEVWALKTPEGAPVSATGNAQLVKSADGASADGSGTSDDKLSTKSWLLVAAGATAGIACIAGVGVIVKKRQET